MLSLKQWIISSGSLLLLACPHISLEDSKRSVDPDIESPKQDFSKVTDYAVPEIYANKNPCDEGLYRHGHELESYSGPPETKNIGNCRAAIKICLDSGWYWKQLEVLPQEEVCGSGDYDCDGTPGNVKIYGQSCGDFDEVACIDHRWECDGAKMVCKEVKGPFPIVCNDGISQSCTGADEPCPEDVRDHCDGIDQDLDGETDEQEEAAEPCYTGPPLTKGVGSCRSGLHLCHNGEIDTSECVGEVTPKQPWCGNGNADVDCDGVNDADVSYLNNPLDVILIIDISGSMSFVMQALKETINDFLANYADTGLIKYGLVTIGDPDDPHYNLVLDLSSLNAIATAVDNLATNGDIEPSYDAIVAVLDPLNPLQISWRQGANKALLVFGDEDAQSLASLTEQDVKAAVEASGAKLFSFVSYEEDYDEIMGPEYVYRLDDDTITVDLTEVFDRVCTE